MVSPKDVLQSYACILVSGRVLDTGEELLKAALFVETDLLSRVSIPPLIIFS